MFAEERLQKILDLLNSLGKVVVKDLSTQFSVTEDCIRKDLKTLENEGKLKRTYGGAVLVRQSAPDRDISCRKSIDISTKQIIAEKAFNLIQDRDTIFLDISTINILLCKLLIESNKKVTVVTNMLEIINLLATKDNVQAVLIGGILNKNQSGFTSAPTIELITKYKFDKSFIGSCGLDVFAGTTTTFDIEDGMTKKSIITSSKSSYLVMEHSKFSFDGNYIFAELDDIDNIITDKMPNSEIYNILTEKKVNLF